MDDEVVSGLPDFEADLELVDEFDEEGGLTDEVSDFFVAFLKTVRAAQLYVQGNPILHQFSADLRKRLKAIWDRVPSLSLLIFENQIKWLDTPVYTEKVGAQDNLAFRLYRDGIRRIEFLPGVEDDELRNFIDLLRIARMLKEDEDDLLTLMWDADFQFIRYEYIDALGDEAPITDPDLTEQAGEELPMLPELELSPELQTPTLREDFEPSLYFLDENEVAHLQTELQREWNRPIKRDVILALLDQFEMGDEDRRSEIMGILREMLPRVLAEGGFDDAALILKHLQKIAEEKGDPAVKEQVDTITAEMSQPLVLEQLVRVLEDGSIGPTSEALATLLSALRPEAIVVLMQALQTVVREEARKKLGETLDRLASMNPKLMDDLVKAEDPRVAAEAARITGRLQMVNTVDSVASLMSREEEEVRIAAVEALVAMRTGRAGGALLKALDDLNRDVRVAAAKGISDLKYSPGAEKLEGFVRGRELRGRDLTEQLAFFEAYACAAGEDSARLLTRMLNGRRFLWFRYSSQQRACAARALGLVGGGIANDALNTGERDRDPLVLSAVHAARRLPEDDEQEDGE